MKRKFIITSQKNTGRVIYTFDGDGYIAAIEFEEIEQNLKQQLIFYTPLTIADLEAFKKVNKVVEVPADLGFPAFWQRYGYKVGNKSRAEKLWKLMTEADQALCIDSIKRYDNWLLNHPATEKCMPETYLHQQRWQNEFR